MRPHGVRTRARAIACALIALIALAAALALHAAPARADDPACTVTWDGGGSDSQWTTAQNWSGDAVPTTSDAVCLPSGATVTVGSDAAAGTIEGADAALTLAGGTLTVADADHASTLQSLAQSGGLLTGDADVHVASSFSWTGGSMGGAGATTLDAGATGTINPGTGSSSVSISSRTLLNRGSLTLVDGNLGASSGATLRNAGTLTLDSQADWFGAQVRDTGGSPAAQLVNAAGATLRKASGSGTTRVTVAVDNEGAVDAQSGTLDLGGGGGPSTTGTWDASGTGSALVFSGGDHQLGAGAQLSGAVRITNGSVAAPDLHVDGSLTLTGGTVRVTDAGTASTTGGFTQTGGTLTGDGELDVSGAVSLTGGQMSGAGSTILLPTASGTLDTGNGSNALVLDQRTLSNRGALTMAGGSIRAQNGATIRNSGTLTFNTQNDWYSAQLYDAGGSPRPQLVNTGTIVKADGNGIGTIGLTTDDSGTIQAATGSIRFWQSDAPATFQDGSILKGSILLAGVNATLGDVDASAAQVALSNGSATVTAGKTFNIGALAQSGGTLTGAGDARVTGTLSWTGGQMTGAGTTTLPAGAVATLAPGGGSSSVTLDQRTLDNHATVTIVDGTLRGLNGATLLNHATLKVNSENDWYNQQLYDAGGAARPRLVNTGTVVKDAGTGTSSIGWEVDNQGTIDGGTGRYALPSSGDAATLQDGSVLTGAILLNGAPVTAHGAVDGHGAAVRLENATLTAADGATLSLGSLTQPAGTLTGAGQVQLDHTLSWTGGQMTGAGSTILLPGADGTVDAGGGSSSVTLDARTLSVRGGLTVVSGTLRALNGATIRNSGTLTLNSENDWYGNTQILNAGGAAPSLVNASSGTIRKTSGTGASRVDVPFDNEGSVDAQTGRLDFGGGGSPNTDGTWSASGTGSSIQFSGGAFTLGANVQADGTLRVTNGSVTAPDLQLDGDLTVLYGTLALTDAGTASHAHTLAQSGGTITGAGTLALANGLTWTGGQMAGTGETALAAAGTGTIDPGSSSSSVDLEQRTLRNAGALTVASGSVRMLDGATLRNSGGLNLNSENDWYNQQLYDAGGDARPRLVNTGTVRKTAGTGTSTFGVATTNDGTIDAQTGQFRFNQSNAPVALHDDSTLSGTITLDGNVPVTAGDVHAEQADVRLLYGTLSMDDGKHATVGTLRQSGGTITGAGDLDVADLSQLTGGQQTGSGVTRIGPDATGTIQPGDSSSSITLDQRTLAVDGTVDHVNGTVRMLNGAGLDIGGTLNENSQADWFPSTIYDAGGTLSHLLVKPGGLLQKSSGTGRSGVGVPSENEGDIKVTGGGTLELSSRDDAPTPPCTSGGWQVAADGSHVLMSGGPRCLAADTELHGEFQLRNSARLTVANIQGADADFDLQGGTLNVTDTSTPTTLRALTVGGGTLTGAGEVDVQGLFTWTAGTMSGTGSTVVGTNAYIDTGEGSNAVALDQRTLTLDGATAFSRGTIRALNGATIRNGGTLTADSQNDWYGGVFYDAGGTLRPKFYNLPGATLRKANGVGTTGVDMQFDNQGAVDSETGTLRFSRGGVPVQVPPVIDDPIICPEPRNPQTGTWFAGAAASAQISFTGSDCLVWGGGTQLGGTIRIAGAKVLAGGIQGLGATLYHEGGRLSFKDPNIASVISRLHLSADMDGPGELDVCDSFAWQAGRMSGPGSLVLCPGSEAIIAPPGSPCLIMDGRPIVNHGTLTWSQGCLGGGNGADIDNQGTVIANSESGDIEDWMGTGGVRPWFRNRGSLIKTSGTGTTNINIQFSSTGSVDDGDGHFRFGGRLNDEAGRNDPEHEGPAIPQPGDPDGPTIEDVAEDLLDHIDDDLPGHGWKDGETPEEVKGDIEDTLTDPDRVEDLPNYRTGYRRGDVVVIYDPLSDDQGTAIRKPTPGDADDYLEGQLP